MTYRLGSLFDGSGGFPLAGALCGIEPVWAAEVEPYPIAVTKSRFPSMKHLGSVTDINGSEIEPVDIITFGSPYQDLSTAGKHAGLKHEANGDDETTRSGLFMEAVRIIREMRGATNGRYPAFALWENVPGAFSSSKGEDFRCVLEKLAQVAGGGVLLFLDLRKENGVPLGRLWETVSASHGECLTLNTGESPSAVVESTLSQILEADAPERYYLSAKACEGILRRAERRGKELPQMLKTVLLQMIERELG